MRRASCLVAPGLRRHVLLACALISVPAAVSAQVPPMSVAREYHTATTLNDGRVLVVGGTGPGHVPISDPQHDVEIYDPASNSWSPGPPTQSLGRSHASATRLRDDACWS